VGQGGAEPAQEARQAVRHARDLAARLQRDGLDTVRDELGPPGDRRQPFAVCERGELAQERPDVGLVARAPPSEDIGVDDDQRLQAAASR
jgi:hypothetical protein